MNTKNTGVSAEGVKEFLSSEKEKEERAAKWTWIIGMASIVLLTVYLTWIGYKVKTMALNPYFLASVLAGKIDSNADSILRNAEKQLALQAPIVAERAHDSIMSMLPTLRKSGEVQIDLLTSLVSKFDRPTEAAVKGFFASNTDAIKAFYEAHQDEEMAGRVADHVIEKMREKINHDVRVSFDGKVKEGFHEVSLAQLRELNDYLQVLAAKPTRNMTPLERLERRFIVAWVRAFAKHLGVAIAD